MLCKAFRNESVQPSFLFKLLLALWFRSICSCFLLPMFFNNRPYRDHTQSGCANHTGNLGEKGVSVLGWGCGWSCHSVSFILIPPDQTSEYTYIHTCLYYISCFPHRIRNGGLRVCICAFIYIYMCVCVCFERFGM